MSKTPSKMLGTSCNFVPKEISTPNKDQLGISKTIYSHISNLHGFLNDWVKIRDKGSKLCKAISSLKLHECTNEYYPHQLKPLTEGLVDALDSLKNVIEGVSILKTQLQALAKLQITNQPVIFTWPAKQISAYVNKINDSLQKEYRLKEIITENIAHCRDEKLIEVYVSSWEFDPFFNREEYLYLFAEVGLAGVT